MKGIDFKNVQPGTLLKSTSLKGCHPNLEMILAHEQGIPLEFVRASTYSDSGNNILCKITRTPDGAFDATERLDWWYAAQALELYSTEDEQFLKQLY